MTILRPRRALLAALATSAALAAAALLTRDTGGPAAAQQQINPADFQASITHPLFPLSLIGPKVFVGEEIDPDTGEAVDTRLESRVLAKTETVAGVTVLALEEKAYEDGELVEVAIDYFAQHKDGSVYYFGELVDNYEEGRLRDHAGQWLAGEGPNEPGVLMPAQPQVGQTYRQELASGIAEDMATVVAVNEAVSVPSGSYLGCLKTKDFSPLEPGVEEFKWYCPGVGMVKEQGADSVLQLTSVGPAPAAPAPTAALSAPQTAVPASGAGSSLQAPSTGDAGLADEVDDAWGFLAVAAALAIAGAATLKLVNKRRSSRP